MLLGSFGAYPWATGLATTGVIFAAAYLLWALQRMIFNRSRQPGERGPHRSDTGESWRFCCPSVVGIVWLGLFPGPVLRRMEPAAAALRGSGAAQRLHYTARLEAGAPVGQERP